MKRVLLVLVILLLAAAAYYYFICCAPPPGAVSSEPPILRDEGPPPASLPAAEPAGAIEAPPPATSEPLPALLDSDATVLQAAAGLIGEGAVAQFLVNEALVPRLVATIDALFARQVPLKLMPVQPLGDAFEANVVPDPSEPLTTPEGDPVRQFEMDPVNFARYAAYLDLLEGIDAHALAREYVKFAPLFQQAYEELGYPGRDFDARLLEAIELLLAAPDGMDHARLVKPEAYYLFADESLEALPAGQKIMIRIGSANAARVRGSLLEIRAALLAEGISPDDAGAATQ